jgi:hypothetical protein
MKYLAIIKETVGIFSVGWRDHQNIMCEHKVVK